jgi:RNA polymerase sigma factor (sigma-70 family)
MCFEKIIKRLSPKLKGIAYKLRRHFCFFNEEDLYQEALVHLWKSFKGGVLEDKTDSYILQGCYFYLKNYIRKHTKRVSFVSLYSENRDKEGLSLEEVLLSEFNKAQYLDDLNDKFLAEAIQNNGLNTREKKILWFYSQGLTTREIGRHLGISHVRVVKLTKEIRKKCQRYLDNT